MRRVGYAARPHQLCWNENQPLPEALQGGSLPRGRSPEAFEPMQQVVGQPHDLEEGLVRLKVLGRNLSESIGVLPFPDDRLGPSSLVVEAPEGT